MPSRIRRLCLLVLLFTLLVGGWPGPLAAKDLATPVANGLNALAEVQPGARADIATRTAGQLPRYEIDATLDPATRTIRATATVSFPNTTGETLAEVYFRLFPNAAYYDNGALTTGESDLAVGETLVDGTPATTALEVEDTALRVALPAPLAPNATATFTVPFTTTIPENSSGSYGIFTYSGDGDVFVLADWHPVLAVYDPGAGWNLAPPTPAGDPTYAASSLFTVRLTAPEALLLVTSGVQTATLPAPDGSLTREYAAGPAREFTMVADADYVVTRLEQDGVTIAVYTEPDAVSPEIRRRTAEIAAAALTEFGERFTPYPFVELDLVQTPLNGALAVSWAGIIFLDGDGLLGWYADNDPAGFEATVAHEVSHLWWGSLVGSDSNQHAFINEGLATVSSLGYLEWTGQAEAERAARETFVLSPARSLLARGDAVADLPATAPSEGAERSWAVYGKGSLGFLAIKEQIGDEAFWRALGNLSADYEFRIAPPAAVLAAFETESGQDLAPLWNHWFEETNLTAEEIAAFAE